MKIPTHLTSRKGFTLVELLVVIVMIAVLAALSTIGVLRGLKSARSAQNLLNLRDLGVTIVVMAQDDGTYPMGWDAAKGLSWADLIVNSRNNSTSKISQDRSLLSPLVSRDIPLDLKGPSITNYGTNPHIFPQGSYNVKSASLQRPSEQILLGDALPRSETAAYGHSMAVYWGMRFAATGNSGQPPKSNPAFAEREVTLPSNILEMTNDGGKGLPAFRNSGKAHFLFVDGHAEGLRPDQLKYKHFAISY